jgi:protein required for attachment to host cells
MGSLKKGAGDMATESLEMLVVVFDGARARFFSREPNGRLVFLNEIESGLHKHTQDAVSDKAGRSFASTHSGVRHAYEPKHDKHKMEKHNFTHLLVKTLEDAYDAGNIKRFAIVAPERSLGEFRALAPAKLLKLVWREVPKELTQFSAHELQIRLAPHFEPEKEILQPKG